jgi:DNA-binding MarR family transcriptional regulator
MEQESWVFLPPELIRTAGDVNAGLLLANIVCWMKGGGEEGPTDKPGLREMKDGRIWLVRSQAALAADTGLSDSQVKRGMAKLLQQGLVERLGRLELLRPTREFDVNGSRGVKIYAGMVRMVGKVAQALILGQLNYWFSPGEDQQVRARCRRGGHLWVAKTHEDLATEIGLTARQTRNGVDNLRRRGLIHTEVHRFDGVPTLHLRFAEGQFREAWEEQSRSWWQCQGHNRNGSHTEF